MKMKKKGRSACALGLVASLLSYSTVAMSDEQAATNGQGPTAVNAPDQQQSGKKPNANADTTSTEIQQITVTAQRRETLLKDTPVSVQAITSQQLDNEGIRSIDDLTRVMPGVEFTRNATTATGNYNDEDSEITVRGIYSSAGASTTGVYIDDTPIQTRHLSFASVAPFPALFDLDRVEMLRGPQGTLFGAGSEGGAVRFIQPEPSLSEQSLYVHTEYGSTKEGAPSYEAGVAFGDVLAPDVLGLRLSVSTRHDGGYVDRVSVDPLTNLPNGIAESNANWEDTATMRAALKAAISKDTSVVASIYHQELRLNDTSAYWETLSDPANGVLLNGNAQPDSSKDPFTLYAVKVNSDLGWSKLSSSTSYFSRNQTGTSDYTQFLGTLFLGNPYPSGPGSAGGTGSAYFTDSQRNVIEELKLQSTDPKAKVTWLAGLFLSRQDESTSEQISDLGLMNATGIPTFPGLAPGVLGAIGPYDAVDRQVAIFGQADVSLTDTLKFTAGLRVANIKSSGQENFSGPLIGPVPSAVSSSLTETPVTPKFALSWQPDADDLFYVSAAKGYRVGGINPDLGTLCAADLQALGLTSTPETYKSDSLWSYEIGSKNSFLNRSLQIDSSAFYVDWKNIQQSVYLPDCGNEFAANLGAATSKGMDTSVRFKPVSSLLLTVDAAYTNARYTQTVVAGTTGAGAPIVTKGDYLSTTPWAFTFAADYKAPKFEDLKPYLHMDYQFNTRQQGMTTGQDPNNGGYDPNAIGLPETKIMALRAGARWDGWDASLFVNNLFNSLPELVHQHDLVGSPLYFDRTWRPRTIGLTVSYRY
jgi:outer membrane receptor protein involved in Fe transport